MGKNRIAEDIDRDGKLDLNPEKAEQTLIDLVLLDHALRDEGSSLAEVLRTYVRSNLGIRL